MNARQYKATAKIKKDAVAMDKAFLARAKRFVKRQGLESSGRAMAALAVLTRETASLVRQQGE